jgi:hypothetical protein
MTNNADSARSGMGTGAKVALGCGAALLAGALLIGGFVAIIMKATSGPAELARDFVAAAIEGDYERAHAHFSAPLKQQQPLPEFREMMSRGLGGFKLEDVSFTERAVSTSEGATIAGTITLDSGTKMPVRMRFVDENGEWKLISYNFGR